MKWNDDGRKPNTVTAGTEVDTRASRAYLKWLRNRMKFALLDISVRVCSSFSMIQSKNYIRGTELIILLLRTNILWFLKPSCLPFLWPTLNIPLKLWPFENGFVLWKFKDVRQFLLIKPTRNKPKCRDITFTKIVALQTKLCSRLKLAKIWYIFLTEFSSFLSTKMESGNVKDFLHKSINFDLAFSRFFASPCC